MKYPKTISLAVVGGLVSLVSFSFPARAISLPPGSVSFFVPGESDPVGALLSSTTSSFASAAGPNAFTGTLVSEVWNDASNPFGALTFTYRLFSDSTSLASLSGLILEGWGSIPVDASYQFPASGTPPAAVDRSLNGDVIRFSFTAPSFGSGTIPAGGSGALLVLQTSSQDWERNVANVSGGSTVSGVSIFAPFAPSASAVPDGGSTMMLLGAALAAVEGLRRKKA